MEWTGATIFPAPNGDHDVVFEVHGVSWRHYEALLRARGESPRPHIAYLDGTLQLVTTSPAHELEKTLLARLIECYAEEADLELIGIGNATFRKKAKAAGLEPDECYSLDAFTGTPELAIEIVLTSGSLDKLEIYRRLGVGEVWFVVDHAIEVHRLSGERWRKSRASGILRGIDLSELGRILRTTSAGGQTAAVRRYRRSLRAQR